MPRTAEAELRASIDTEPTIGLALDIESSSTASEPAEEENPSEDSASSSHEAVAKPFTEAPSKEDPLEDWATELPSTSAPPSTLVRKSTDKVLTVRSLDDENILRVTNIRNVLRKGGSVLRNSAGSAETYLLSKCGRQIDIFISHNWVVARWRKFWALALYFNMLHAVVVSYVLAIAGCALNMHKVPTMGLNCMLLGFFGFFLMLMFGHDIPFMDRLFWRQQVFLDKICIHQTDSTLKAAGINSLGAFLRHSNKMLVLFNSMYFKKLWTVYEAACFLYLHRRNKLELLPVDCASVVLKATAIVTMVHFFSTANARSFSMGTGVLMYIGVSMGVLSVGALGFVLRNWALQQIALFEDLRTFHIGEAHCTDEDDRIVIKSNICSFVRAMGLVQDSATDDEALQAFDRLVQDQMPALLRSTIGHVGIPYKYALVAGIGHDFYTFDHLSIRDDPEVMNVLATLLRCFVVRTTVLPVIFLVCGWLSNSCRPRSPRVEVAIKLAIALSGNLVAWPLYTLNDMMKHRADKSEWWLAAFAAASIVQMLVTAKLFSWRPKAAPVTLAAAAANELRKRSWGSSTA